MRGLLVGFHFCPVLLSGVALFLVAFSSSLHTDLSRDEVFERVEGNTWMFYTSQHNGFIFRRDVNVSSAMGEKSDDTDFGCLTCSLPPLPIRLCNILKISLTGIQFPFFPLYTLLAMGSDKNNWNFLRSTLVTLRASSYSPLYDIKNQDNLLKQGEQLHTNCFMKVSKINFYSDDNMKHDCVVFPGFELTGHITKTLYADEISCGLRCLQDENCQSYNSKSDANDAKKECQLSNQTKKSSPENLRRNPRSTYYGRGIVV